jgi:hypothetical protein
MKSSRIPIGVKVWTRGFRGIAARRVLNRYAALIPVLLIIGITGSCGGGYGGGSSSSPGSSGQSASITNSITTLQAGATYTFNATTPSTNGYAAGIMWSLSPATGAGTLSNATGNGFSSAVMYQAPSTPPNPNMVTITATPSDMRVGSAKDTFMVTAAPMGMGMMVGQFAIAFSGFNSTGETLGAVGSLIADGAGKITGGAMDLNRNRAPSLHVAGVTGTYTLDSGMHGSISLTGVPGAEGPLAFSLDLASDKQSGLITGTSANGVALSGQLLRQDQTAFALARISSDFAFKLEANSPDRVAIVGKLNIASSAVLSGLADQGRSGSDAVFAAAPVAGHLTAPPDANGRGTFTLRTPAGNSSFVFYVASGARLLLLETDSGGAVRTRQLGLAERQALPFSAATADASASIRGSGFDTQASSFGAVSVVGSLAIENLSHATLSWDARSSVAAVSIDSLRSDVVTFDPLSGRGMIDIANGFANNFADSVVFYLASPGQGFFLDRTSGRFNRAIAGDLEASTEK